MYSHEQLKLMDAAAISISSQRHIQSVIEELIETALAAAPTPAEIPATTNPAQISSLPAEAPAEVVRDAERYRACNGSNCGCTDGISHSDECISEHDAIVNEAALADHVEHGGWKCFGCGYDGQDNQRYNRICASCGVHR